VKERIMDMEELEIIIKKAKEKFRKR